MSNINQTENLHLATFDAEEDKEEKVATYIEAMSNNMQVIDERSDVWLIIDTEDEENPIIKTQDGVILNYRDIE